MQNKQENAQMVKTDPMSLAIDAAKAAALRGEVPVGAVVVNSETGDIIAVEGNRTLELKDPTAHAEMLAIRKAAQVLDSERLVGCDLYVTLEPCPMCAQAISFARVRRLYYGADDAKGGGVDNGARVFSAKSCHHKPEVYGGIREVEAGAMLKAFFEGKR